LKILLSESFSFLSISNGFIILILFLAADY
jgi:hypothetical protein